MTTALWSCGVEQPHDDWAWIHRICTRMLRSLVSTSSKLRTIACLLSWQIAKPSGEPHLPQSTVGVTTRTDARGYSHHSHATTRNGFTCRGCRCMSRKQENCCIGTLDAESGITPLRHVHACHVLSLALESPPHVTRACHRDGTTNPRSPNQQQAARLRRRRMHCPLCLSAVLWTGLCPARTLPMHLRGKCVCCAQTTVYRLLW